MSNIINKIRLSGTDYTLSATTSGGVTSGEVETMISAATSGYTARFAEDEEVTAAALNDLNERISGISGNNVVELTQAQYDALVSGGTVDPTAFYIITDATPVDISNYWTSAQTQSAINQATAAKQDTLVSGTNIKTINNESILGSGNIDIQGGGVNVVQTTGYSTSDVMSQDAVTESIFTLQQYAYNSINSIEGHDNDSYFIFSTPNEYYYFGLKNAKINGRQVLSSDWSSQDDNEYNLVETSAITTTITSSSTDAQVPSAKAVNDKLGGLKLVKLTQAQYDALATKDNSTLYVIVN